MNVLLIKGFAIGGALAGGGTGIYYGYPYISDLISTGIGVKSNPKVNDAKKSTKNEAKSSDKQPESPKPGNTDSAPTPKDPSKDSTGVGTGATDVSKTQESNNGTTPQSQQASGGG